jgi:hypothetical protein
VGLAAVATLRTCPFTAPPCCGLWAVGCGLWAVGCGLWAVGSGLDLAERAHHQRESAVRSYCTRPSMAVLYGGTSYDVRIRVQHAVLTNQAVSMTHVWKRKHRRMP